ncbi:hypothetical protein GTW78_18125 [Streptomyces sp. SID4948]|nr:hypothetical protein [Streptomyces sp. SID4948]
MDTDHPSDLDGIGELAAGLVDEITRYLAEQRHTAHPLVTATTQELVADALATRTPAVPAAVPAGPVLPGGLWRLLPDRLLSLHPARRGEGIARLRITTAEHLDLTALVLERWGWGQTGSRTRSAIGRRCILGAQHAIFRLGYGTEHTAVDAGRQIQAVLTDRGITTPYPQWNEQAHVGAEQALAVVRAAAATART